MSLVLRPLHLNNCLILISNRRECITQGHNGKRIVRVNPHSFLVCPYCLLKVLSHFVQVAAYQAYLLFVGMLRFLYIRVLKRRDMKEDLPYPKRPKRLPVVLSREEVGRLINSAKNLFHRAMLMTLYAAGLRRSELCRLKVRNIDSQRMVLRIEHGKGGIDRDVPLSPKLLETLRDYWRWMRPKTYLFPGTVNNWRADKPITSKVIWEAVHDAAITAGIDKRVTPHTLRHTYATHLLEAGADLRTIQLLLGHADLSHTTIYLHLSQKHLQAAPNLLEQIRVSGTDRLKRSRKRCKPESA